MTSTLLAVLAVTALGATETQAGPVPANAGAWCEDAYFEATKKLGSSADFQGVLESWKAFAPRCQGTGAYEARLAIAYAAAGQSEEAKRVLRRAPRPRAYAHLVELAELQVAYFEAAYREAGVEDIKALRTSLARYVRKHPDVKEAVAQLGALQVMLGEFGAARVSLESALPMRGNPGGVHRNLTICYSALRKHQEALRAADSAVEHFSAALLASDEEFMGALASSLEAIGERDRARQVRDLMRSQGRR